MKANAVTMKGILLALAIGLGWAHTGHASDAVQPVIAVTIEAMGRVDRTASHPLVLMAVWADGRIAWSEDQARGGPPFREAKIDPEQIQEVLMKLDKRSVFEKDGFRRSWFGPDSRYHSICLSYGEKYTRIETWHELFEENPDLVVVNGGVTPLHGRNREDVIARDTEEFQEFRGLWTHLRASISNLIPAEGIPVNEPLELNLRKRQTQ